MVQAGVIAESVSTRRAFIAAPATVDTSVIRLALESRGIAPYEIDDLATLGLSIPEILDDCIKRADLVVAVIRGGQAKENILFELGYASAMKKRILALVPPDEQLPFWDVPYLRIDPDNREAIDFGLDQVLNASPSSWNHTGVPIPNTKAIGGRADELLAKLRVALRDPDERVLTEIVAEAIFASGVSSIGQESLLMQGGRADFAIWSDDFEPWVGNPLLVEIRGGLAGPSDLARTLEQVTRRLEGTKTAWGMVLYGSADFQPDESSLSHARVFLASIEEFLKALQEQGLGEYLSQWRNRRVHGRG
jgi:hypothetical protein